MIPASIYIFLLIELLAVSYLDIIHRKISNIWPVLNLVIFLFFIIFVNQFYKFELQTFFYSSVFFVVGLILFSLKIMGAGDSKFLFSFYLLVPIQFQESALLSLLQSTIVIGGLFFLFNIIQKRDKIINTIKDRKFSQLKGLFGKKFAFAPVILFAWLLFGWINRTKLY